MLSKRSKVCASSTPPSMHATNPTSGFSVMVNGVGVIVNPLVGDSASIYPREQGKRHGPNPVTFPVACDEGTFGSRFLILKVIRYRSCWPANQKSCGRSSGQRQNQISLIP